MFSWTTATKLQLLRPLRTINYQQILWNHNGAYKNYKYIIQYNLQCIEYIQSILNFNAFGFWFPYFGCFPLCIIHKILQSLASCTIFFVLFYTWFLFYFWERVVYLYLPLNVLLLMIYDDYFRLGPFSQVDFVPQKSVYCFFPFLPESRIHWYFFTSGYMLYIVYSMLYAQHTKHNTQDKTKHETRDTEY